MTDKFDYDPDDLLQEVLANPRVQKTLHDYVNQDHRFEGVKTLTREDIRRQLFAHE
jgi:hypothetical protein